MRSKPEKYQTFIYVNNKNEDKNGSVQNLINNYLICFSKYHQIQAK